MKQRSYEIWLKDDEDNVRLEGESIGSTFDEACYAYFVTNNPFHPEMFDAEARTWFGVKVYPTSQAAALDHPEGEEG